MRNLHLHKLLLAKTNACWMVLALSLLSLHSFSQTTNINATVNTYFQVIDVVPGKACVRLSSVTGLAQNNKVLLVQMKGASINQTNALGYGDTTALNNAGNYEVNTVCRIKGDSVFMVYDLMNNYTVGGKIQLVKFGEYVNAVVTAPLTASTWNNTNGTGGVIAIFVEQNLTLNSNITADTRGFAGGAPILSTNNCNNSHSSYFYNAGSTFPQQNGAAKGENLFDLPAAQSGGRGAPSNGGGGGNDHNNAGGGGANLVAGGIGGGNSSNSSCQASFVGEAGKALRNWGGTKIFFGGGGGAGHKNYSGSSSGGAAGGGIIFIHAANVIGNGNTISSSGGYGGNSASDGAGGGGGGGTIIMDVAAYTGALNVFAEGGHGGDSENGLNINTCFGGGGGGGGGAIYFAGATPALIISVNGGGAGVETGRDVSCKPVPVAAGPGSTGVLTPNYTFRQSSILANYCSQILPVKLSYFSATADQKKVLLQWNISNPEEANSFVVERMDKNSQWIAITSINADEFKQDYTAIDNDPEGGYNTYRLKIIEKNNSASYSVIRRVYIGINKESFSIFPNPALDKITIRGNFAAASDIQLRDISGKLILRTKNATSNSAQINLPSLSAGVYMLHINNTVEKLVIR